MQSSSVLNAVAYTVQVVIARKRCKIGTLLLRTPNRKCAVKKGTHLLKVFSNAICSIVVQQFF